MENPGPSHSPAATDINKIDGNTRVAYYHPETPDLTKDFRLTWTQVPLPQEGDLLSYVDESGDGYFFHVFAPAMSDLGGTPMSKDIIFVLDRSGSMSGTKIDQLKDSFSAIVDDLHWEDRFNVVFFDDRIDKYSNEIIVVTDKAKENGQNYVPVPRTHFTASISVTMVRAIRS